MSKFYTPRYTPCGYSIKSLRNEAQSLQKTNRMSRTTALNCIAQSLKYSNWDELIRQKSDPKRDDFFYGMYNDRKQSETTRSLYRDYLKREKLEDNKDSYRLFVLQHWESYKELGMTNFEIRDEPLAAEVLLEELLCQVEKRGATGLMPQSMGAKILESTVCAGNLLLSNEEVPPEIRQGYLETALFCICGIRSYQRNPIK